MAEGTEIKTQCPHCKAEFDAPERYKGKQIKCLKCNQIFTIKVFEYATKADYEKAQMEASAHKKQNYFDFDYMISPVLIKFNHLLIFILCPILAITLLVHFWLDDKLGLGIACFFAMFFAYFNWRILAEFYIVIFKIKEELERINHS